MALLQASPTVQMSIKAYPERVTHDDRMRRDRRVHCSSSSFLKCSLVVWTHLEHPLGCIRASLYFYGAGDNVSSALGFVIQCCAWGQESCVAVSPGRPYRHTTVVLQ